MQKTYAEIIDETLAAGYTRSNRGKSMNAEMCYYLHPETGVPCAVGRCCIAPQSDWVGPFTGLALSVRDSSLEPDEREKLLMPEYRGKSAFFWMDLQYLHDTDWFWLESGLSKLGETKVEEIRNKWCHLDSTN